MTADISAPEHLKGSMQGKSLAARIERIVLVRRWRASGASYGEIAMVFGVTPSALRQACANPPTAAVPVGRIAPEHLQGGMRNRPRKLAIERYKIIKRWRDDGATFAEIGAAFAVSSVAAGQAYRHPPAVEEPEPLPPLRPAPHIRGTLEHGTPMADACRRDRWRFCHGAKGMGYSGVSVASALGLRRDTVAKIGRSPKPTDGPSYESFSLSPPDAEICGLLTVPAAKAARVRYVVEALREGHAARLIAERLGVTKTLVLYEGGLL